MPGLPTFRDIGRPDLRNLTSEMRREAIEEVPAANSAEEAVLILEQHLGFLPAGSDSLLEWKKFSELVSSPVEKHETQPAVQLSLPEAVAEAKRFISGATGISESAIAININL
ncbi:hypothetical protein [Atlantibacter sp.]|uniref:hypothetical protein n=1 Tax=Atlantibacter sp. TaxID=1903473 RepID=UPI00289E8D4C|nr:hypothetical protein [Atlantibacter sp.]